MPIVTESETIDQRYCGVNYYGIQARGRTETIIESE